MYSELIYTRCGQGIDILKGGAPIENAGFKVFACSNDVLKGDAVDLRLLQNVAQRKESFSDPDFMDDAYLFMTPDFGGKILLNFHPRLFDKDAKDASGDYAHRPGNFVNQLFIGSFGDSYPYEFFGDDSLWDAQKRNEAFYYENAPAPLKGRELLTPTKGRITDDDIARFVAEGRRDALKKAIAFILAQFSLPREKRKYLVVKDENSTQIELWIAAIERAFSPRMAAGLSFASRLDDFVNSNQYAVDLNGKFQPQIDYQNPDQKTRWRAMIVGVDERDRDDAAAARPAPHLPFVVLDGKSKTISFDADVSHSYYEAATDCKRGESFCKNFLQIVDLSAPSLDVLKLYDAFRDIVRYQKEPQSSCFVNAIGILSRFKLLKSPLLKQLYDFFKKEFAKNLDAEATFTVVLPWLERVSADVGDDPATVGEYLKKVVCSTFVESVFTRPDDEKTDGVYRVVSKSAFAPSAARLLASQETVAKYDVGRFTAKAWRSFTEKFLASTKGAEVPAETLARFLRQSAKTCFRENDERRAAEIVALHANLDADATAQALFEEAKNAKTDVEQTRFFLRLASRFSPRTISSADDLDRFYAALQSAGLASHIGCCLACKAETLRAPQEMKTLLQWTLDAVRDDVDLKPILRALDDNLGLSGEENVGLARLIQKSRPRGLACKKSAHVYALEILDRASASSPSSDLRTELEEMVSQGFPSIEDAPYASSFLKKLSAVINSKSSGVFKVVVQSASNSEFYSSIIVKNAIDCLAARKKEAMRKLILVAVEIKIDALNAELVKALSNVKRFGSVKSKIRSMLKTKNSLEKIRNKAFFTTITTRAKELRNQNSPSFFARLFSRPK